MTYSTDWHVQKRVVLVTIEGDLDLKTMHEMAGTLNHLLDTGQPPVHIIYDLREVTRCDIQIIPVRRTGDYLLRPEMGIVVTIGGNAMTAFIITMIRHLVGFPMLKASSTDDALTQLQAHDDSLNSLSGTHNA